MTRIFMTLIYRLKLSQWHEWQTAKDHLGTLTFNVANTISEGI